MYKNSENFLFFFKKNKKNLINNPVSPEFNRNSVLSPENKSILKIRKTNNGLNIKNKKLSLVNFSAELEEKEKKDNGNIIPEENYETKITKKIPKLAEVLYKVVILLKVARVFNSRISLQKPDRFTKEDKLVFANDLAYNSQKMENDIFLKKYLEKNVILLKFFKKNK